MRFLLSTLLCFSSISSFAQNEDKVYYEKGIALQYAHYETDLLEMMLSNDSIKSKNANKIVDQLQEQAISQYNLLLEEFPNSKFSLDALYQKAEAQYSLGLNADAKESFLKVISINPKKGKSLLKLAYLELEEKNYSKALKYAEERRRINSLFLCGVEQEVEASQLKFIEEECKIGLTKN